MDASHQPRSSTYIGRPPPPSYFCPCLNVQLRRESTTRTDDIGPLDASAKSSGDAINRNRDDPFFKDGIAIDVSLPENRFTVSRRMECLCCTRPSLGDDQLLIASCLNCRVDTHAFFASTDYNHRSRSIVYVSRKMNTDAAKVAALMQSDDYSPVYEIVVRPFMANEGHSMVAFGVLDECAAHNRCEELKRSASDFLDAESEATKERIRDYKKERLMNLKHLESRVQQDKNILMQRIASAIQDDVGRKPVTFLYEAAAAAAPLPPTASTVHAASAKPNKAAKSAATIITYSNAHSKKSLDVFAMDEDDVFTPSEPEEDESVSDEDECPSDDAPPPSSFTASDVRLFATSMPVSMPTAAWKRSSGLASRRFVEDDGGELRSPASEKDDFKTDDPEWMAASIKALAMSVRGDDSTDLFGARPRPRLNTLD